MPGLKPQPLPPIMGESPTATIAEGILLGTGRRWEICSQVDEGDDLPGPYEVWFDGCEYGGEFATLKEAFDAVEPWEPGN